MVHFLKGKLSAYSQGLGCGSEFYITLPRGMQHFNDAERQESSGPINNLQMRKDFLNLLQADLKDRFTESLDIEEVAPRQSTNFDIKKARILIIDDEPSIREIIKSVLQGAGYSNFILASDGVSAKEAVRLYQPDIFISDINMPRMRGDEFFEWIHNQAEFVDVPFIFISAVHDEELITNLQRRTACAVLAKPIDVQALLLELEFHLRQFFGRLQERNPI
jgi:two-component system chemotaxis response regulator CheY